MKGDAHNCLYPHKNVIQDEADLKSAVSHDYVCAEYQNSRRNIRNFIGSDCLPMDCDNDHTEDPAGWKTPEDVKEAFPGVAFAVHYSRSNMREKNGKTARPKFHILFPIEYVTDANVYRDMKKLVLSLFPYFDLGAKDAARFFFGTSAPEVALFPNEMNLTKFLAELNINGENQSCHELNSDEIIGDKTAYEWYISKDPISEGQPSRHIVVFKMACFLRGQRGMSEREIMREMERINEERVEPPLEPSELKTQVRSACKYTREGGADQVFSEIIPEKSNDLTSYKPSDFSDVGQAEKLSEVFANGLKYTPATGFLCYRNGYWQESESSAQAAAQELTRRQLREANHQLSDGRELMKSIGAQTLLDNMSRTKAEKSMSIYQSKIYQDYQAAQAYQKYAIKRRSSASITATLKEARPMLEILPEALDADCFALNTPAVTYDLRKGMDGAREHSPEDFATKITAVSPSTKGAEIWQDCLNLIFQHDQELIDYVQAICGLAAIGKVYVEALIIAYGDGRNGKSTFWNTISRVLGLYSGHISADALTVGCRRNVKPELAEARGKRILIAAETQEGARLDDSTVKQLCSTDDVFAEKKFMAPFSFRPSHMLVLYTNHLPRIKSTDDGIWRRMIVIPFTAKITGENDRKNFADYLFENAGESVLAWIIEGAKKIIELNYHIAAPKCVQTAINEYRVQNDWLHQFIADRCETGEDYMESSSLLYAEYRTYCDSAHEPVRHTGDFYNALEKAGFMRVEMKRKQMLRGLRIKREGMSEM